VHIALPDVTYMPGCDVSTPEMVQTSRRREVAQSDVHVIGFQRPAAAMPRDALEALWRAHKTEAALLTPAQPPRALLHNRRPQLK
jgi:hypothetical protein